MKFNDWIEKLINKNKIDKLEVLKIEKDCNIYYFTIEQVIGFLKIIEPEEQKEIKKMLEEMDENKEEIKDYLTCLAVGCINAMEDVAEDNEEAM